MQPIELLGIGSAILALIAFVGNEYGTIKASSFWYDAMNFLGSIGLLTYAYSEGVIPFMITNSVWALVAGIYVAKYLLKGKGR